VDGSKCRRLDCPVHRPFSFLRSLRARPSRLLRLRFKLNVEDGKTGLLPYYSNHPVGVDNPAIKRIVVAIHSSAYDAKTYCESVMMGGRQGGGDG